MFDNYIIPVVYGGGALALLSLFLVGWALPSFLKGKSSYILSVIGLVLAIFPWLDVETSIIIEVFALLLGLVMIGWGLPFKGRRGLTLFLAFMLFIIGVAALSFAIAYGVINRH